MLNQEVTRQAAIIAYIDDFKLMLVLAIIVMPLLLLTSWLARAIALGRERSSDSAAGITQPAAVRS